MSNGEVLVSLDIGTSEVKVIVGEVLEDSINIIGVGTAKTKGMRKGAIVDIDETVYSIKNAIKQAEHMVDMKIESVIVAVNGNHVQLHNCHGVVAVQSENREIGEDDIDRVIDGAQVMSIPPEREIIDVIPKQFIVDGLDEITDPRGMIGVRLEMEGTIITCSKTVLHNILKCVERAELDIADICLQPLASGTTALSKDERTLGVALIDVGGGCTTVSVFEDNHLVDTSIIPLGGDNISKDLSIGLRTTAEDAENIKLDYGHAHIETAMEEETVETTIIGSNQKEVYNQLEIAEIIEARIVEILEIAHLEMRRMGYSTVRGGYVLTGGTMRMPGVLEVAEEVFQANARIAIPDYIGVREPQYTAGVGTIQFAYKNAKIQGKNLAPSLTVSQPVPNSTKTSKRSTPNEKKEASSIGGFIKRFFE